MFTRVPWEVTGGYLEGNYNMGGGAGKAVDEATKYLSDRTGVGTHTNLESQGKKLDKHILGQTNIDEQIEAGKQKLNYELTEGNLSPQALSHFISQPGKYLHNQIHGGGGGGGDDDTSVTQRDTSAFAQSKKPRKKKKGLLALQTPSAKAARFRAGKRRFRVRPTGKTGVNTGAKSSGVSVPKG